MQVPSVFYGLAKLGEDLRNFSNSRLTHDLKGAQNNAPPGSIVGEDVWIPTSCRGCFYGQCALRYRRVNGVIVNVEGIPEAPHNQGRVCAIGRSSIMDLYDPYRVKVPLKRTNPEKGLDVDPKWVEITWDEALNTVAENLKELRKEEPKQVFLSSGDVSDIMPFLMVWRATFGAQAVPFGFSGFSACGCSEHTISVMAHHGFIHMLDPDHCDYAILCGISQGFETQAAGITPMAQRMADARVDRGMKLVVIDPRGSVAASKADEWVPIRPGTDLALMLAMLHVILHELGIYDAEFIKKYTNAPYLIKPDGYYMKEKKDKPLVWDAEDDKAKPYDDKKIKDFALEGTYDIGGIACKPAFQLLKDNVKQYTPEWASEISTVPAETIRRITGEFVEAAKIGSNITLEGEVFPYRPAVMLSYHGAQRHRCGMFVCMACKLVNFLIGNPDVPGGMQGLNPTVIAPPLPDYYKMPTRDGILQFVPYGELKLPPSMNLHECFPLTIDTDWMMTFTLTDPELHKMLKIPYTIKAHMNHYTNAFHSLGDLKVIEEAYKKIPFHVGISVWIDEPTLFADIVLPENHWLERLMTQTYFKWNLREFGYLLRQPVVKPLYNTKNTVEIFVELSERIGMLYGDGGFNDMLNKVYLQEMMFAKHPFRLDINTKHSDEEMIDVFFKAICGPEHDLKWFKEHGFWLWKLPIKQHYRYPGHQGVRVPFYFEYLKFIGDDLAHRMKNDLGVDWDTSRYLPLPRWEADPEHKPSGEYDLYLMNYKTGVNVFSATASNPWLSEIYDFDSYIMKAWMNATTAKKKGIKDGDEVWVESRVGKAKLKAKVSECVHSDVVAIGGAFGGKATNPYYRKGVNFASLIPFEWYPFDWEKGTICNVMCPSENCTKVKVYKA